MRKYFLLLLCIIIINVGLSSCRQNQNQEFSFAETTEFSIFFADGIHRGIMRSIFLFPEEDKFTQLRNILQNATPNPYMTSNIEQVITITSWEDGNPVALDIDSDFPFDLMVSPNTKFIVWREGGNPFGERYFIETNYTYFEIDAEAFMNFILSFGSEFYIYAELPTAIIGADDWIYPEFQYMAWESSYFYYAVDGTMRPPIEIASTHRAYETMQRSEAVITLRADERIHVLVHAFHNEYGVAHATGIINVTRNGETVWNGTHETYTSLWEWVPEIPGRYDVEIIADFNSDGPYGGTITWRAAVYWEF